MQATKTHVSGILSGMSGVMPYTNAARVATSRTATRLLTSLEPGSC